MGLRVLIVNQYYPPDGSATAEVFRDTARALVAAGHEVIFICGRPSYGPHTRSPWRPVCRSREDGIVVDRVGSTGFHRRKMAGRAANYISFLAAAAWRVLLYPRFDVVVAGTDPPLSAWVGLLAARGRPVVYRLQDLHPDHAKVSQMIRQGPLTRLWEALHLGAMKRCTSIVCLGDLMAEVLKQKGVRSEVVSVLPNGAWVQVGNADPAVVAEVRGGKEFSVVHAGNLGGTGGWDFLADAAKTLDRGCGLVFVGDGFQADSLKQAGIRVIPFRPAEQLPSVMAAGDLQVVSQRPGMEGLVVPSKVYSILAHCRPVLAAVPASSEVAHLVTAHGCGLVARPDDAADIADKIAWARKNPAALAEMSRCAGEAAQQYDREELLNRFVELVEQTANGRNGK